MTELKALLAYCAELLAVADFADYCPNGLQVEGRSEVRRIVTGVTASQALIEAAVADGADALLVHHGFFWKGEDPRLIGIKGRRVRGLMSADLSLLAYHLPLDAHPQLGNNRQLAERLGIVEPRAVNAGGLLWQGRLTTPLPAAALAERIASALGRPPLHIPAADRPIATLAWCTGGCQREITAAAALGVDAFLSGEISESTTHQARESGVDYFAIGHHASERDGIRALGEHLAERFCLAHRFVEIDNPA
jgi:dinuclear metal center YbgI/SA1388 family protein